MRAKPLRRAPVLPFRTVVIAADVGQDVLVGATQTATPRRSAQRLRQHAPSHTPDSSEASPARHYSSLPHSCFNNDCPPSSDSVVGESLSPSRCAWEQRVHTAHADFAFAA